MGNIKDFRNDFPAKKNTNDGPDPSMEVLIHLEDDARVSHLNKLVEAVIAHEDKYGTDLNEVGTHAKRITDLEATSGTDEKTKVTTDDTTQGFLNSKVSVTDGLTVTVLNPSANEVLQFGATFGTGASEFCEGNDSRLSDARTPTTHAHAHVDTTGKTTDDHHNQAHDLGGADHTVSGLTIGHVLTALTATTFGFAAAAGGSTFIGLTDTPGSFVADKWMKVNSGGTAIEFTDEPAGSVTIPGVIFEIIAGISPTGTETVSSAVYENINANYTNLSVSIPYTGTYLLQLRCSGLNNTSAGSEVRFRILDGVTPITTDDKRWEYSLGVARESALLLEPVQLDAGDHTLTIQWEQSSGAGSSQIDTAANLSLLVTAITGSGAHGTITNFDVFDNIDLTVAAGETTLSSKSVTTTENEEILVSCLIGLRPKSTADNGIQIYLRVDGNAVIFDEDGVTESPLVYRRDAANASLNDYNTYGDTVTITLSAGAHTVALIGTAIFQTQQVNSRIHIAQFRGGLVPVYNNNGELVQDKPTSNKAGNGLSVLNSGGQVVWSNEELSALIVNSYDSLDDSLLHSDWTEDIPTTGTITETTYLAIVDSGGAILDFYGTFNAPGVYRSIEPYDFIAKVFVDNIVGTSGGSAALIHHLDGTKTSFHRMELNRDASTYNVRALWAGTVGTEVAVGQDFGWLALVRRGREIYFLYSTNTLVNEPSIFEMIYLDSTTQDWALEDNVMSLRGLTYGGNPAIDHRFNNFSLDYENTGVQRYNVPENVPILEYNAAGIVNIISAPGADNKLIVTMNDGAQYWNSSPLTMNMATSGLGGLEVSATEASDTWYYFYAVKSTTLGKFEIIASPKSPRFSPDDYSVYRYLGFVRNDGSSDFLEFYHKNVNFIQLWSRREIGSLTADSAWHTIDINAYVPETCESAQIWIRQATATDSVLVRPYGSSSSTSLAYTAGKGSVSVPIGVPGTNKRLDYQVTTGASGQIAVIGLYDDYLAKNRTMPVIQSSNIDDPTINEYLVEDNFNDSTINPMWTVTTPGSSTAVEGSDGIVLTPDVDDDPLLELAVPEFMSYRNWILQVHVTTEFLGSAGDAGAASIRVTGLGGGSAKIILLRNIIGGGTPLIEVVDSGGSDNLAKAGIDETWFRIRCVGDEIRTDFYIAAATSDPDEGGHWQEWDSSLAWYRATKSAGTYNWPQTFQAIKLEAGQWSTNPGVKCTFRKFKLKVF